MASETICDVFYRSIGFAKPEHLKHKKVRLEVFLATTEGHVGLQNVPEEKIERNCVANAMLWEQVMLGERDIAYPGKEGVREDRDFRGPLQHRTWIFSGGAGNTTYSYRVIASIMASSIATLELTRLGSYLDGDRVNYAEDLLERAWKGAQGGRDCQFFAGQTNHRCNRWNSETRRKLP